MDVLKLLDTEIPEQVIAVPQISLDSIPHRAVFEPQLAEQLVEVPTPVTHVGRSLFTDRHGHEWCRVVGRTGAYWWRVGTSHTQWAPPQRDTPPAQGGIEILGTATLADVVCVAHAAQVPAVQGVSVHRQIGGSSCSETGTHSAFSKTVKTPLVLTPGVQRQPNSTENSGVAAGAVPAVFGGVLASRTVSHRPV